MLRFVDVRQEMDSLRGINQALCAMLARSPLQPSQGMGQGSMSRTHDTIVNTIQLVEDIVDEAGTDDVSNSDELDHLLQSICILVKACYEKGTLSENTIKTWKIFSKVLQKFAHAYTDETITELLAILLRYTAEGNFMLQTASAPAKGDGIQQSTTSFSFSEISYEIKFFGFFALRLSSLISTFPERIPYERLLDSLRILVWFHGIVAAKLCADSPDTIAVLTKSCDNIRRIITAVAKSTKFGPSGTGTLSQADLGGTCYCLLTATVAGSAISHWLQQHHHHDRDTGKGSGTSNGFTVGIKSAPIDSLAELFTGLPYVCLGCAMYSAHVLKTIGDEYSDVCSWPATTECASFVCKLLHLILDQLAVSIVTAAASSYLSDHLIRHCVAEVGTHLVCILSKSDRAEFELIMVCYYCHFSALL